MTWSGLFGNSLVMHWRAILAKREASVGFRSVATAGEVRNPSARAMIIGPHCSDLNWSGTTNRVAESPPKATLTSIRPPESGQDHQPVALFSHPVFRPQAGQGRLQGNPQGLGCRLQYATVEARDHRGYLVRRIRECVVGRNDCPAACAEHVDDVAQEERIEQPV